MSASQTVKSLSKDQLIEQIDKSIFNLIGTFPEKNLISVDKKLLQDLLTIIIETRDYQDNHDNYVADKLITRLEYGPTQ